MMDWVRSGEDLWVGLGWVQKFWVGLGFEKVTHDPMTNSGVVCVDTPIHTHIHHTRQTHHHNIGAAVLCTRIRR